MNPEREKQRDKRVLNREIRRARKEIERRRSDLGRDVDGLQADKHALADRHRSAFVHVELDGLVVVQAGWLCHDPLPLDCH